MSMSNILNGRNIYILSEGIYIFYTNYRLSLYINVREHSIYVDGTTTTTSSRCQRIKLPNIVETAFSFTKLVNLFQIKLEETRIEFIVEFQSKKRFVISRWNRMTFTKYKKSQVCCRNSRVWIAEIGLAISAMRFYCFQHLGFQMIIQYNLFWWQQYIS